MCVIGEPTHSLPVRTPGHVQRRKSARTGQDMTLSFSHLRAEVYTGVQYKDGIRYQRPRAARRLMLVYTPIDESSISRPFYLAYNNLATR
jgi:hypothetical protein